MKTSSLTQQLAALLLATLLPLLTQCGGIGGYKSIHYSKGKLSTPPTTLSQRDYPFDAKGRYRTDWVKGGSTKKRSMSSFRSSAAAPSQPSLAQNTTPPPPSKSKSKSKNRTIQARVPKSTSRKSKPSAPSTAMTVAANTTRQRKPSPRAAAPEPVYTPPPAPSPPKAKAPAPAKPKARYHTIGKGDTLWGISRKYKVGVAAIKSANGLSSDLIRPGQTLRIP
ncbi:MAG: LysM peptidoglycan-binding domain-containing protein [Verrucomicrobiales bacterium]|nr:LysM peptidoglycan-binding domain-containing protein [Verrucomicrobiales bacterium]